MRVELKYGIYTGLGICLWIMAEHLLGFRTTRLEIGQFTRVFVLLLPIVMIPLGIRDKNLLELKEEYDPWEGIKCGLAISSLSGGITALFFVLYQGLINPHYLDLLIGFERARMIGQGIPDSEIGPKIEAMRTMNTVPILPLYQFAGSIVSGLAISLIATWILRKKAQAARSKGEA